ncbi:MAG TPA: hypothetical protein PLU53_06105 [Bacteroidia bacterium]|nr:hypothetical protein [Bacteroidia bacterium]
MASLKNPFPGLRSFDNKEHHLFFGREIHIRDLLNKLNQHHFVAIVGTSGSGKSSLVKAGLLPGILNGGISNGASGSWLIASMRPGNEPLKNLANALASAAIKSDQSNADPAAIASGILKNLKENSLGLVQAVRQELPSKKQVLILLDQFEEIFRYRDERNGKSTEQSEQFVRLIIEAVHQRDVPIYVVLTLRSDFLGDCARFEGLPEAINDGHYLVPRMNREQIKRAITGPIEYVQGKIAPRLIQQVLDDLGDNPDQLPILQHALMQTWDTWVAQGFEGEPMDLRHYEMTGGMEQALSAHAEQALSELNTDQQRLAELVMKSLTVKGGDNRGIRRPTSMLHLREITGASLPDLVQVLAPFRKKGRTFILPSEDVIADDDTIMDISHESFMRVWDRLRNWVDEEAESADLYKRLCTSAQLYQGGKSGLWRNPELQVALDWKEKNQPNAAWAEQYNSSFSPAMDFLERSRVERVHELKRKRRRSLITNVSITTFLLVISWLSFWAMIQTKKAEKNSMEAMMERDKAEESRRLAELSEEKANQNAGIALLSSEKADSAQREMERQKLIAEKSAIASKQSMLLAEERRLKEEEQSKKVQTQIAIVQSEKEKAKILEEQIRKERMLNLAQLLASKALNKYEDPQLPALLALQAYTFQTENGGAFFDPVIYDGLYAANDIIDKQYSNTLLQGKSELIALTTIPGKKIVTIALNGTGTILNADGRVFKITSTFTLPGTKQLSTAYLSANGRNLVTGYDDNEIKLWDISGTAPVGVALKGHSMYLRSAAFSPDGKWLVTSSRDNSICVWDLSEVSKGPVDKFQLEYTCRTLCFHPNSASFVAGCDDGKIRLFRLHESNPAVLFTHGDICSVVKFNVSGSLIAAGFKDGKAYLMSPANASVGSVKEIKLSNAAVDEMCFNVTGSLLAISSADQRIRIFPSDKPDAKPLVIKDHQTKSKHLSFDDGKRLYATCDFTLRFWETDVFNLYTKVKQKVSRKFTQQEWSTYVATDLPYDQ